MTLKVGDIITFERTFAVKDVELFTEVSGDEGIHHITPDEQGRLVTQGLLTATLPTKIFSLSIQYNLHYHIYL
ncbi:dehydratase [Bacillus sp. Xin]|nr:dehydratase [Bacillus sp. Xin]NSW39018.1 dehydratase [Bacillus sp. Xin1]